MSKAETLLEGVRVVIDHVIDRMDSGNAEWGDDQLLEKLNRLQSEALDSVDEESRAVTE